MAPNSDPAVEVVAPDEEPVVFPPHEHRLLDYPYDGEPAPLENDTKKTKK